MKLWLASNVADLNRYHRPFREKKRKVERLCFAARNVAAIGFVLCKGAARNG